MDRDLATKQLENLPEAEWGNAEQIFARFGLTRGTLIKLADSGRIKSVVVKTRDGARKGVRLFLVESIRQLLVRQLLVENLKNS
jgi:hypothetical protein